MDLEQRVQALEQEVEILKNQIQVTLLAIQEQLLNQRYPTLHGEELAASVGETATQEQPSAPLVKRVSLNPAVPAPQTASPSPFTSDAETQPTNNWSVIARLEKWAVEKIERIGAKRTRELIKLYAKQGRISPQIYEQLIQFVSIYETGEPHKATGTFAAVVPPNGRVVAGSGRSHPAHADSVVSERSGGNHHDDEKRALVMRLIDGLQGSSKSRRNY